jgi:hypothetical protein
MLDTFFHLFLVGIVVSVLTLWSALWIAQRRYSQLVLIRFELLQLPSQSLARLRADVPPGFVPTRLVNENSPRSEVTILQVDYGPGPVVAEDLQLAAADIGKSRRFPWRRVDSGKVFLIVRNDHDWGVIPKLALLGRCD